MTEESSKRTYQIIAIFMILIAIVLAIALILQVNNDSDDGKKSTQTTQSITSTSVQPDTNEQLIAKCEKTQGDPTLDSPFETVDQCAKFLEEIIGMSENDAIEKVESNNFVARVVQRDDEDIPITMDFSLQRINLSVNNGKVTNVDIY